MKIVYPCIPQFYYVKLWFKVVYIARTCYLDVTCSFPGASLKIIQLLQHFEHLVSPLAGVVNVCVAEYGHKSIVAELMR